MFDQTGTMMKSMAPNASTVLLTAEEFLDIDFGRSRKAELDNGYIHMMAGGTGADARIQRNVFRFLAIALRGSGCSPYGSDMGVRTHDLSVRYPDVSVFCGRDTAADDGTKAFDDPKLVVEILSESTAHYDQNNKLEEYKLLTAVDTIAFIDPGSETIRIVQRTGPQAWTDAWLDEGTGIALPQFDLTIPRSEIFARD
jgi:Uma2 family endonuclease